MPDKKPKYQTLPGVIINAKRKYKTLPGITVNAKTKKKASSTTDWKMTPSRNVSESTSPASTRLKQNIELENDVDQYKRMNRDGLKEISKEDFNNIPERDTRSWWSDSRAKERGDAFWNGTKKVTAVGQFSPEPVSRYSSIALNSLMGAADTYFSIEDGDLTNAKINAIGAIPLPGYGSIKALKNVPGLSNRQKLSILKTSLSTLGVDLFGTVADLTDNFGLEQQKNGGTSSKTVTCTCGHSWDKSDSSKKDATVCHICGKNNMKDGGWLDKYQDDITPAKAQKGNKVIIDGKEYDTDSNEYRNMLDKGQVGTMKDDVWYGNKSELQPVTIYSSKDKNTQKFYDRLKDENGLTTYESLLKLGAKYGAPHVTIKDKPGFFDPKYTNYPDRVRPHYDPLSQNITLGNDPYTWYDEYISELAHQKQLMNKGALDFVMRGVENFPRIVKNKIDPNKKGYNEEYDIPGSIEYEAHKKIEPELIKEFDDIWYKKSYEGDYYEKPGTFSSSKPNATFKSGGWLDKYGKEINANEGRSSAPENWVGEGYSNVGRNYSPAWGGQFAMGGSLPGSVGFTYARTQDAAPVNGPYAKKTKASAQNGQVPYNINDIQSELRNFIKQGEKLKEYPNIKTNIYKNKLLTDKLNNLNNSIPNYSTVVKKQKEGGIIEDDRGQWAHPGKITKINSNQITMKGVDYPVLGISDAGDQQMMYPEQEYTFKGKKVTEFPMAQDGTRMPIYTTDPKKIQAYADSLALHNISLNRFNLTKKFAETLGKGKDYNKSVLAQKAANDAELWRTDVTNSYNNLSSLNKKEPTPVERIENIPLSEQEKKGWDIHGIYSAELYKKPVQPYILKKEEEPTLKRKPVKVETIKSKSASTPGLKTIPGTPVEQQPVPQRGEYRVSYYNPDIKDWSEQAFQTEKESEKFASEMSGRGYGGSYGNVTQTRKVNKKENGGWLSQYK